MGTFLGSILSKISLIHLNVLFLLGLALFCGTLGGRIFQKLRIPQVVGYIVIGVIIGESGFKIVDHETLTFLQPFNYFALGLIGFMVGGELKKEIFSRYGKQLITILLYEGIAPFLLVTVFVGVIGSFFFSWQIAWALALLMGAIASATDPASTSEVLREYKSKGPLTTTILGIVALDDGLALLLFALASTLAGTFTGHGQQGLLHTIIRPFYDVGGAVVLGGLAGFALCRIFKRYIEEGRLIAFCVGTVLLVVGISLAINVELILATMVAGIIVTNFVPRRSEKVFHLVSGFTPPIYVLFFVLVGAKLNFMNMTVTTVVLSIVYLFGTVFGKAAGSRLGARVSNAAETVRRHIPLALFSQAGIAIGLSILAAQYFSGEIGNILVIIITTTTFLLQMAGPYFTKMAISKAGEAGLNITEEDLMENLKADDVMEKNPPLIYNNMNLDKILGIFSASNNLYYPVVDKEKKLLGVITIDNLKNMLSERELSSLLLADDVMEPAAKTATPESAVISIKETMDKYALEYLPVVESDKKISGFIERRMFNRIIATKMMELQRGT